MIFGFLSNGHMTICIILQLKHNIVLYLVKLIVVNVLDNCVRNVIIVQ